MAEGERATTIGDATKLLALPEYLESLAAFLAESDPPTLYLVPELLPVGVISLIHGEPRARKSFVALELARAAAMGTAPFGLARFHPAEPVNVLYVQEEDSRPLTRQRIRALIADLPAPGRFHVIVRQGVNLDEELWKHGLIHVMERLNIRLLVLDAARRLSRKTDEGPSKVSEFMAVLRYMIRETGVTIVIVHHDVKPSREGQDSRRRSQRASGGDWFAASECPIHVERLSATESLVFPEDFKFGTDPAPFTMTTVVEDQEVRQVIGRDTTPEDAAVAGSKGKLLAWLRLHPGTTKTDLRTAGFAWDTVKDLLDALIREGLVDAAPGERKNVLRYFAVGYESSPGR